jgi:hypothetical protein
LCHGRWISAGRCARRHREGTGVLASRVMDLRWPSRSSSGMGAGEQGHGHSRALQSCPFPSPASASARCWLPHWKVANTIRQVAPCAMVLGGSDIMEPLHDHVWQAAPCRRGRGSRAGPRAVAPGAGHGMPATLRSHSVVVPGGDYGRWRWRRIDESDCTYLGRDGITSIGGCRMKEP